MKEFISSININININNSTNTLLSTPGTLNFHHIQKNNNLCDLINAQTNSNYFLNKKTLREETKNNKQKEPNTLNEKNKIFFIKKIADKAKEAAEEKKIKKYTYRGSKYRGVSRNGKTWQVLIMINRNKNYIGNFKSEDEAAKAYDEYAMKFHKGKARLNFFHQGFMKYVNEI